MRLPPMNVARIISPEITIAIIRSERDLHFIITVIMLLVSVIFDYVIAAQV